MGRETFTEVQEEKSFIQDKPRRNTPKHMLIKMTKIRERENIKSKKGNATNNIQGNPYKVIS